MRPRSYPLARWRELGIRYRELDRQHRAQSTNLADLCRDVAKASSRGRSVVASSMLRRLNSGEAELLELAESVRGHGCLAGSRPGFWPMSTRSIAHFLCLYVTPGRR